jgi:hypothetical protein
MSSVKHQRQCSTCVFAKPHSIHNFSEANVQYSAGDNPNSWYKFCSNPSGNKFQSNIATRHFDISYYKGQDCHSSVAGTTMSKNSNLKDFIQYQKGAVNLKLQNNKMYLSMNVETDFNAVERRKIEQDLADVFEVVTLASEKIPKHETSIKDAGVDL